MPTKTIQQQVMRAVDDIRSDAGRLYVGRTVFPERRLLQHRRDKRLQLRQFVEDEPAYLGKHMKAASKHERARGRLLVEELKTDGKKRRANAIPDDVRLSLVEAR